MDEMEDEAAREYIPRSLVLARAPRCVSSMRENEDTNRRRGYEMEAHDKRPDAESPVRAIGNTFFTRKLAMKLRQQGVNVPQAFLSFMDTPLKAFDEKQAAYFDQKISRLFPSFVSTLEEIFSEIGANEEGWEDMLEYLGEDDTPIKICASAVLIRKDRKEGGMNPYNRAEEQNTKKIQLPPQLTH